MPRVVPELLECPKCGLNIEAGKGPGGVAWHDCAQVQAAAPAEPGDFDVRSYVRRLAASGDPVSIAQAQDGVLRLVLNEAVEGRATVVDLARVVQGLAELKEAEGEGGSDAATLLAFLGGEDGDAS